MNNNNNEDFDILKVIELARNNKYERTVAGFCALDKIDVLPVPKKLKHKKAAVQALFALSDSLIQYGYFSQEDRKELEKQNKQSDHQKGFAGLFSNNAAPNIEEETEEEYIPQEKDNFDDSYEEEDYYDDDRDDDDDSYDDDDDDDSDDDTFDDEEENSLEEEKA